MVHLVGLEARAADSGKVGLEPGVWFMRKVLTDGMEKIQFQQRSRAGGFAQTQNLCKAAHLFKFSLAGESPLDQLVPVEGVFQDPPGQLVRLRQVLGAAGVQEGQKVLDQLRGRPKLPLGRELLNRHLSHNGTARNSWQFRLECLA